MSLYFSNASEQQNLASYLFLLIILTRLKSIFIDSVLLIFLYENYLRLLKNLSLIITKTDDSWHTLWSFREIVLQYPKTISSNISSTEFNDYDVMRDNLLTIRNHNKEIMIVTDDKLTFMMTVEQGRNGKISSVKIFFIKFEL